MSPISYCFILNKFTVLEHGNFLMCIDPEISHIRFIVTSMLGSIFLVALFRQRHEGEKRLLRYPCVVLEIKSCRNLVEGFTSLNVGLDCDISYSPRSDLYS